MNKRILTILIGFISISLLIVYLNTNSHQQTGPILFEGATMGTRYHIKVIPGPELSINIDQLSKTIKTRLDEINHLMSTYKSNSEISQFNQHQTDQWMTISAETAHVINAGQKISQLSHGAFDMTIGNLVNLWGFGPTINLDSIPKQNKIDALIGRIGHKKLLSRHEPHQIKKTSPEVYLDLSAIAKGYAVDAIAKVLLTNHIDNFMVEIGGEIITHGLKEENKPWVIGIQSPASSEDSVQKKLYLTNVAMATSGDYRNYFEEDGRRYSHTIDPRTGYPIKHQLASVTVISSSCMEADAYATAIMVLGPTEGMKFANQHNLAIFMLVKQGDVFGEQMNELFTPYLTK